MMIVISGTSATFMVLKTWILPIVLAGGGGGAIAAPRSTPYARKDSCGLRRQEPIRKVRRKHLQPSKRGSLPLDVSRFMVLINVQVVS